MKDRSEVIFGNRINSKAYKKALRSKKKCYVKVRAYKVVKGKKIYGSYSKVLKVTVK